MSSFSLRWNMVEKERDIHHESSCTINLNRMYKIITAPPFPKYVDSQINIELEVKPAFYSSNYF